MKKRGISVTEDTMAPNTEPSSVICDNNDISVMSDLKSIEEIVFGMGDLIDETAPSSDGELGVWNVPTIDPELMNRFIHVTKDLAAVSHNLTNMYSRYLSIADKTVCDLEHVVVFQKEGKEKGKELYEYMHGGVLPACLEGVDPDKYTDKLVDALGVRRDIKNHVAIYGAITNKFGSLVTQLENIASKVYSPRTRMIEDETINAENNDAPSKSSADTRLDLTYPRNNQECSPSFYRQIK